MRQQLEDVQSGGERGAVLLPLKLYEPVGVTVGSFDHFRTFVIYVHESERTSDADHTEVQFARDKL